MAVDTSKIVRGADLMVFVKNGTSTVSIAFATSHSLSINRELVSASTKDFGGKWAFNHYGVMDWSLESSNLVANTGNGVNYADLLKMMRDGEEVEVVFGLEGDSTSEKLNEAPDTGWKPKTGSGVKGKALISALSVNADNGSDSTMSVTFTGNGPLEDVGTTSTLNAKPTTPVATASK